MKKEEENEEGRGRGRSSKMRQVYVEKEDSFGRGSEMSLNY